MAELVEQSLDDMVVPLRDLMDRGIFSETEIKSIVSRRREYEYLLRRRVARKADFLRYVEIEMKLERLRKIRTKKINEQQERKESSKIPDRVKKNNSGALPIGDVHIIQLIHLLFFRVIQKFKSDVTLHLQHAAFAKESKSYHKLTTIYTEALQYHPRNVELWIEAASHEFFGITDLETGETLFGGGSMQGARVLMQRALRINPTSQDLWIQNFCLELHFIQKLRGRKEILQGTTSQNNDDDEKTTDYTSGKIPIIVYKNAIDNIPEDIAFRMNFLDVCKSFPNTEKVEDYVASSIEQNFLDKPEAWIATATYRGEKMMKNTTTTTTTTNINNEQQKETIGFVIDRCNSSDDDDDTKSLSIHNKKQRISKSDNTVLETLYEAIEELPTEDMYLRSIRFARQNCGHYLSIDEVEEFVTEVLKKVEFNTDNILSPDLVMELSDYFVTDPHNDIEKAIQLLKDFSAVSKTKENSDDNDVSITLHLASLLKKNDEISEALTELQCCLNHTPVYQSNYMQLLLELFGAILLLRKDKNQQQQYNIKSIFEKILLFAPNKNPTFDPIFGVGSVATACLCMLLQHNDKNTSKKDIIDLVVERSTYCDCARDKSIEEIQVMVTFFDTAITYTTKIKQKKNSKLRRLMDKAIQFFETCAPDIADRYRTKKNEFMYL